MDPWKSPSGWAGVVRPELHEETNRGPEERFKLRPLRSAAWEEKLEGGK